jgi:hypothetical protein
MKVTTRITSPMQAGTIITKDAPILAPMIFVALRSLASTFVSALHLFANKTLEYQTAPKPNRLQHQPALSANKCGEEFLDSFK